MLYALCPVPYASCTDRRLELQGVQQAAEHRVVADRRRQVDDARVAQAHARRVEGGVAQALVAQQLAGEADGQRFLVVEGLKPAVVRDRLDRRLANAGLA